MTTLNLLKELASKLAALVEQFIPSGSNKALVPIPVPASRDSRSRPARQK